LLAPGGGAKLGGMKSLLAVILILTTSAMPQNKDTKIGDDYAKAALRVVIAASHVNQPSALEDISVLVGRTNALMEEADAQARRQPRMRPSASLAASGISG